MAATTPDAATQTQTPTRPLTPTWGAGHDAPSAMPTSSASHTVWPAVVSGRASNLLTVLFQLEQSQWWSADRLIEHQLRQLQPLLEHAAKHVPWYRRQFEQTGFELPDKLTLEDWRRLPTLTRRDLQSAGAAIRADFVPNGHGPCTLVKTSGSTGAPVAFFASTMNAFFWQAFTLREHYWHRRDFSGTLASIRHFSGERARLPDGERGDNWGSSTKGLYETGPVAMLNINNELDGQVAWLEKINPDYLLTHPTNVIALARRCDELGVRVPALRQVRTISEMLTPEVRQLCREVWNVDVVDIYSTREAGYAALQCPEHEHYHVQSENVFLEVLDEQNRPCGPGEIGRVVVTPMHNYASPLLRYELGDYAEVGGPCPCGRGLPVLKRVLGRSRNMVRLPDGGTHWPAFNMQAFCRAAPISQLQIVQTKLDTLKLRVRPTQAFTPQHEADLTEAVRESLGRAFRVEYEYVDQIARSKGGKFEDFICDIDRVSDVDRPQPTG